MDELIFQRADGSGLMDAKCKPLGQLIVVLELIKCKKIYKKNILWLFRRAI
jgi:hypothetical protein